jgi:hypothetical protein
MAKRPRRGEDYANAMAERVRLANQQSCGAISDVLQSKTWKCPACLLRFQCILLCSELEVVHATLSLSTTNQMLLINTNRATNKAYDTH